VEDLENQKLQVKQLKSARNHQASGVKEGAQELVRLLGPVQGLPDL